MMAKELLQNTMTTQEHFQFIFDQKHIKFAIWYLIHFILYFFQQNWKCIKVSGGVKEQKAFEKTLFNKTAKSDAEILLLDGLTIVFKSNVDLLFYVIGSSNENELLLNTWVEFKLTRDSLRVDTQILILQPGSGM